VSAIDQADHPAPFPRRDRAGPAGSNVRTPLPLRHRQTIQQDLGHPLPLEHQVHARGLVMQLDLGSRLGALQVVRLVPPGAAGGKAAERNIGRGQSGMTDYLARAISLGRVQPAAVPTDIRFPGGRPANFTGACPSLLRPDPWLRSRPGIPRLPKQALKITLGLLVAALAERFVAQIAAGVDQVLGGPDLVREAFPGRALGIG
jgi:hypothetical protein